jgi:glutamate-5-semialdehyde dehydrogenase
MILLNNSTDEKKNQFLDLLAESLSLSVDKIIEANVKDLKEVGKKKFDRAFIQRLELGKSGIEDIIRRIGDIKKLDSGLGETIEMRKTSEGLILKKVRVPIGTIAIIYEARPEVTIDAVSLCVKSGNNVVLKGGSESLNTNLCLMSLVRRSLKKVGIYPSCVRFINDRKGFMNLIRDGIGINLVIARGGYDLVKTVMENSKIPVLAHSAGGARIYIDQSADFKKVKQIIVNAKTSKPAACNSLDTILFDSKLEKKFIHDLLADLRKNGIKVLNSEKQDWNKEFLDLLINYKTVSGVEGAIKFINMYSKGHTEAILAQDEGVIDIFLKSVDAAAIFVNCSPRLHDGFVFGLGAEMGISTSKLHARGPVGLKELTTYKWEVRGNGQIR